MKDNHFKRVREEAVEMTIRQMNLLGYHLWGYFRGTSGYVTLGFTKDSRLKEVDFI